MGLAYHLASIGNTGALARYVRIGGTPAAPIKEADVVIRSPDANSGMYSIFSHDGGLSIWASGDPWQPDPAIGHGLDYSSDGGATWINRYLDLPEGATDPGREYYASIHGWQNDPRAIGSKIHEFGTDDLDRYDDGTTKWAHELGLAGSNRPYSIWAVADTDVAYAAAATVWQNLWRSLNRGDTWASDASFLVGIPGDPYHVVARADGTIWVLLRIGVGGVQCRTGVWGGPWSDEVVDAAGTLNSAVDGRKLGIDETGAVWAYLVSGKVFRRDPATGVWALSLTTTGGGLVGSIWVTDSENILVTADNRLYFWDGSSWTDYRAIEDLGLVDSTYLAIWGTFTDEDDPILQNQDPAPSETGVAKDKTPYLEIYDADSGVDIATVEVYIEGALAYDGATDTFVVPYNGLASFSNITASTVQLTFGFNGFWPSSDMISIRAVADDNSGNSLDETYSWTVTDYIQPTIDTPFPAHTTMDVAKDSLIEFKTHDEPSGSGIDSATINCTVDGTDAIINGVFQAGWNAAGSLITANGTNGYDVAIEKSTDMGSYEVRTIVANADDNDGNAANQLLWSFRTEDYLGPLISPVDPTDGQPAVPVTNHVSVDVTDDQLVNSGSIRVEIDVGFGYVLAYEQGGAPEFKPGYNGPASTITTIAGGYRVTIDLTTDFPLATQVSVRVTAADPEGNPERS